MISCHRTIGWNSRSQAHRKHRLSSFRSTLHHRPTADATPATLRLSTGNRGGMRDSSYKLTACYPRTDTHFSTKRKVYPSCLASGQQNDVPPTQSKRQRPHHNRLSTPNRRNGQVSLVCLSSGNRLSLSLFLRAQKIPPSSTAGIVSTSIVG